MTNKVLYEELCPAEFLERIKKCPIAYLPLGTLEWHGPHLPLGADSIQSYEFFKLLAKEVGGIVLPSIFLGPDRYYHDPDKEYYGMDIYTGETLCEYKMQQLVGSAYWIPDDVYKTIILSIASQLSRAGFKILVAHGHGPSTNQFMALSQEIKDKYGLECLNCWTFSDNDHLSLQSDHAAANETSITMAVRKDLVQLDRIKNGNDAPIAIAGDDPRTNASCEYGNEVIQYTLNKMKIGLNDILNNIE